VTTTVYCLVLARFMQDVIQRDTCPRISDGAMQTGPVNTGGDIAELFVGRKQTIGELLNPKRSPIVVPDWQRHFSWEVLEVQCLWLDLLAFANHHKGASLDQREYSLGSLLLAEHEGSYVLLDGQNRLATATILLSVIRDYAFRRCDTTALRIQQEYISVVDEANGRPRYTLTLNRSDRDFFRRWIQDLPKPDQLFHEPQVDSHQRIWQARNLLVEQLEQQCSLRGHGKQAMDWLVRVRKTLTHHVVVRTALTVWTPSMQMPRGRHPHRPSASETATCGQKAAEDGVSAVVRAS